MIHEELEWCDVCEDCAQYKALGDNKYLCVLEGGRCNGYFAYKQLKAENAELRARLEKAVELPAKVGDRVFYINGFAPDFAPAAVEEFEIEEILIQKSTTIFRLIGVDTGIKTVVFLSWYNKRWFTELEAAEARLKEIKEKKND